MASAGKESMAWTISNDVEAPEERTFTQALREKYLADDGHLVSNNFVIKIDIRGKPQDHSRGKAELGFLRNVVLNDSNISQAGLPEGGLEFLCPNVVDLDLSTNRIKSWYEVTTLFGQLPHLKYVNLARNPLRCDQKALTATKDTFPAIENLVLNDTHVSWKTVSAVCKCLPSIRELHICGNNYTRVCEKAVPHLSNIECLRMNNNHIKSWEEIWKLNSLPKLKSLIISDNPIENIFYTTPTTSDSSQCHKVDGASSQHDRHINPGDSDTTSNSTTSETRVRNIEPTPATNTEGNLNNASRDGMANAASAVCQNIINEVLENVCIRRRGSSAERAIIVPIPSVSQSAASGGEESQQGNRKELLGKDTHSQSGQKEQAIAPQNSQNILVTHIDDDADGKVCDIVGNSNNGTELSVGSDNKEITGLTEADSPGVDLDIKQSPAAESNTSNMHQADLEGVEEKENSQNPSGVGDNPSDQSETQGDSDIPESQTAGGDGQPTQTAHTCHVPFAVLESLCISNTRVSTFDDLQGLSQFPKLHSLRMKGKTMVPEVSQEDRRKILVACLPNVTILNGSEVTPSERDKNESFFLQHYKSSSNRPARFGELIERHGNPCDFAQIDLSFCEWAEITVVYENAPIHTFAAHVVKPLGKLRTYLAKEVLCVPRKSFRMYLYKCSAVHAEGEEVTFDELFLDSLPLSRYNVMPGDEIHIEYLPHDNRPISRSLRCSLERD